MAYEEMVLTRLQQITHDLADLARSVSQELAALTLRVEALEQSELAGVGLDEPRTTREQHAAETGHLEFSREIGKGFAECRACHRVVNLDARRSD